MQPAARVGDMHIRPLSDGPKPRVGGPLTGPGAPTVLIGDRPAAVVGGPCQCNGPPDALSAGSATVLAGDRPLVRVGDATAHGGVVVAGCPTVQVG